MKAVAGPPQTPVLDKMQAVHSQAQTIGEFLDWLGRRGYVICRCGEGAGPFPYVPAGRSTEELLADCFGIDLDAAERERRALLDFVRKRS